MPTEPTVTGPDRTHPGVIELGVIDLGPAGPGGEPPVATALPRPADTRAAGFADRLWRWWPLLALSVGLLASTGAAAPIAPGLSLVFQFPVAQRTAVALTGQDLYVATGTPASALVEDPLWWLSAVRITDGTTRWRVLHGVAARPSAVDVQVVDGVPLVTGWRSHTAQTSRPAIDVGGQTTAYHPETGQPQWTRSGFLTAARDGQVILELVEYDGNPPIAVSYRLTGVELATGEVRWGHQIDLREATHAWALAPDARHLALLRRDGRLTVRELDTGAESVVELGQAWHDASVVIAGDLVRVSTLRDRRRTLTVYDRYPLQERWALTDLSPTASLTPCGPVLCLQTTTGLTALDPQTGRVRWEPAEVWQDLTLLGPPWPDGQLQVSRAPAGPAGADAVVVDAATGAPGLRLGSWRSYGSGPADHPYPLVDQRQPSQHRPGHPRYDPGTLWLGRIQPGPDQPPGSAGGEVELLGGLDGVRGCAVSTHHIACVTTGQEVTVWRID